MKHTLPVWSLVGLGLLPFSQVLTAPDWWTLRNVQNPAKEADDFAVINQGQLKHLAYLAYVEMEAVYATQDGAGATLQSLVLSWNTNATADDYAVATVGQVKALSRKFHERLVSLGRLPELPAWLAPSAGTDDYAAANIGQAKRAFSFAIPSSSAPPPPDPVVTTNSGPDNDGISADDETRFGLDPNAADGPDSTSSQGFVPDALGRLQDVIRHSAHGYVLDAEGNIDVINL